MCNDCNDDDSYFPDPPGLDCCGNIPPEPPRVIKPCDDCDDPTVTPVNLVTTEKDGNPCDDCFPNHPEPPIVDPPIVEPPQPTLYYSGARSRVSTRNNCPVGQVGSLVTVNLQAGAFTSTFSQADADKRAENWLDAISQTKANQVGTCSDDTTDDTVLSELNWMGDAGCPPITTLSLLEWGSVSGELEVCL